MTDADRKRAYVSDLYRGTGWKRRVAKMTDKRITAIYLDHQRDGRKPPHDEMPTYPVYPEQLDMPTGGDGVHNREDEFEIY